MGSHIRLGLCCISLTLKAEGIAYRHMTYKSFISQDRRKASKKLAELCLHNAEVLNKILRHCVELGIARYRIPSDIFPLITHPALNLEFNKLSASAKIKKSLRESGKIALDNNLGLSFHPSQFIVIASQNSAVRKNSAADINFNAEILDIMGIPATKSYPINIHINTAPNSFKFRENFENGLSLLSDSARARLVIENEDKGHWNVSNLEKFLKKYSIPIAFDFLHHRCNSGGIAMKKAAGIAQKTWEKHIPIFHYSESFSDAKPRSHSDFCVKLPPKLGFSYDCMIEAKSKDLAIIKLLKRL